MARDLNRFQRLRRPVLDLWRKRLQKRTGAIIHPTSTVSLSARLIGGQPEAIEIGEWTLVAFKSLVVARHTDGTIDPVKIGSNCFIGGGAIVTPGVTIGDQVIVGAGSVVFSDIPSRCAVAGNPARIIRRDIEVGPFGRFLYAAENQRKNVI